MRLVPAILVVALVLLLAWRFPYALQDDERVAHLVYLLALLVLVGGSYTLWRQNLPQAARNAAIWIGIVLLLVLGYSFRHELPVDRLMGELHPSMAQSRADGTLSVRASRDGHFHIEGEVNGVPVDFMVDTGASDIVLSPADAKRAGIRVETLRYDLRFRTANGVTGGARVRLRTLTVGNIVLHDVPVAVNRAEMGESLLGMEFLRRLDGYRVENDTLILQP